MASSGASTPRGCGPRRPSRARLRSSCCGGRRRPYAGPRSLRGGGGDKRLERGETPLFQMRSVQSLEGNRLQARAGYEGGGAGRTRTGEASGNEQDRAPPPPRPRGPPTSRVGVRNGERGRGLTVCCWRKGAEVGLVAPSAALAFLPYTPLHSFRLRVLRPHSFPCGPNY